MKSQASPKERIAETAFRLFNAQGVHLTGINQIIEESQVAKKTFYSAFPSKTQLIIDFYHEQDRIWFSGLERFIQVPGKSAAERLLSIFDYLQEWFGKADFFGCPFVRGLSDFGSEDSDGEIRNTIHKHFTYTQNLVRKLLKEARPEDYEALVPILMTLFSGSAVVAQASGSSKIVAVNRKLAATLLGK